MSFPQRVYYMKNSFGSKRLTVCPAGIFCLLTVVVGMGVLGASTASAAQDPIMKTLEFLKVSGSKIVTSSGEPIYLRGFQGVEFYSVDTEWYMQAIERGEKTARLDAYAVDLHRYTLTDFDLDEFQDLGANCVRVWFQLHEIEKKPYLYSETSLTLLEKTINDFGRQGIYVILVLGGTGQNPFVDSEPYLKRGLGLWNRDNQIWERTVALWGTLAKRLKNNPAVAGYDLINEPQAADRQTLHAYYQDVIQAIRAEDKKHILFLETDVSKAVQHQIGGFYDDENLAVSFHYYYPAKFTLLHDPDPNLSYPGNYQLCLPGKGKKDCHLTRWTRDTLATLFNIALRLPELAGRPVFVGEFGADGSRDQLGGRRWVADVLGLMNERGLHYTLHRYKHRVFKGYWIIKPEVAKRMSKVRQGLRSGRIRYEDLTDEQKRLLTTEVGYQRREGMADLLRRGFAGQL